MHYYYYCTKRNLISLEYYSKASSSFFVVDLTGTVIQIEKALINDRLRVSNVS